MEIISCEVGSPSVMIEHGTEGDDLVWLPIEGDHARVHMVIALIQRGGAISHTPEEVHHAVVVSHP